MRDGAIMNDNSLFQLYLLSAIVIIIVGVLILVGIGKTIDSVTSTTIGSTLTGLIGALGGHAIGSSQATTQTGNITQWKEDVSKGSN